MNLSVNLHHGDLLSKESLMSEGISKEKGIYQEGIKENSKNVEESMSRIYVKNL